MILTEPDGITMPKSKRVAGPVGTAPSRRLQVGTTQESDGLLHSLQSVTLTWLQRSQRLALKIDEAFAGEPFLPNLAPTAPANKRRFRAFCAMHREGSRCFERAVYTWLAIHGMLPSQIKATLTREGSHAPRDPQPFVDESTADLYVAREVRKNT